jgi:hypothetical protein
MRSRSGIAADSAFRNVVFPEPVPPETSTLSSASTQRQRKSAASCASVPSCTSSSMSKRSWRNFRIVSSGPESESGGMIALTRDPSGSRASTSGDDSSIRRPTWPTIFVMIRRRCDESVKRSIVDESRPFRSIQISCAPLTMISEIDGSESRRSSGP